MRGIDNNSGHYKPGAEDLQRAVKVLAAEGADISATLVSVCRFPGTRMSHFDLYRGPAFEVRSGSAARLAQPG